MVAKANITKHIFNLKTILRIFGSSKNDLATKMLFFHFNIACESEAERLYNLLNVVTSRIWYTRITEFYSSNKLDRWIHRDRDRDRYHKNQEVFLK